MDEENNILNNQEIANVGSSTIYLLCGDKIEIANSKLIIKSYFYMI